MSDQVAPAAAITIPAEASAFNYNPPPSEDPQDQQDFRQSLLDVTKEIEAEWAPTPEVEADPEAPVEQAPEVAAPAPEPAEAPEIAKGMDRLVQREVALQAKEAAFQARESEVTGLRAELTKLRGAMPAQEINDRLRHSPSEAIKALGHNPETVVRLMIAEQLKASGQPVPAELQKAVEQAAYDRRVAELEMRLANTERDRVAAADFNTLQLGAREYVKQPEGLKATPLLAAITKKNPDAVHQEIMEEILLDARNRMSADPNGRPITYEQAARQVETRWAKLKAILVDQAPVDAKQAPVGTKTPPQTKPPTKPLRPWERNGSDIGEQGIQEALREYNRLEAARKAQR